MLPIRETQPRTPLMSAAILLVLLCLSVQSYAADQVQPDIPQGPSFTVTGRVFVDENGNGHREAEERGLPDVLVSDGLRVLRTDSAGFYRFEGVDRKQNRFVFVVTPSGYRNTTRFYSRYSEYLTRQTADFALAPAPESARRSFTFAQITDIHVNDECESLKDDLSVIARLKPAFAIATGDLAENGRDKPQIETYWQGIKDSEVPVVNVPGNHDIAGATANYEQILGPTHYSFDYGGYHFVVVNSVSEQEMQYEWLKNDLAAQPTGAPVMVFQHYPPDDRMMDFLGNYNTLAVFSGHWHTTKTFPYGKNRPILYVNSATLRFGGIDASPRGFVLAKLSDGKLEIEHRFGGVEKHLVLVCPADGGTVAEGHTDVIAVSYDSGRRVQLDYRMDNGQWKPMAQVGAMTWTAKERGLAPGKHDVAVRARFHDSADPLEDSGSFESADGALAAPQPGHDWPMFRHDPDHSGLAEDSVNPPLHMSWSRPLGAVTHVASPVVAGDTVYMTASDDDMTGLAGVYALDAATGRVKWHYRTDSAVKNAATVADGRVFATTVDGKILALDARAGKSIWQQSVGGSCARWVFGSPVVLDGIVYAGVAAQFAAFDAATGRQIWSAETSGDWISCYSSLAVSGDVVYVGSNFGKGLFGVDKQTGKEKWRNNKEVITTHASPVIAEGKLFYAANCKLHALDPASGNELWAAPLPGGWPISSPAVRGHRVVVGSGDGKLYCMGTATGKEQWSCETGGPILFFGAYSRTAKPVVSSPAISGEVVYFGGVDGRLYALELATGKPLWSYDLGVPVTSSPAVSGNSVFVSTFDGTVYAFSRD